MPREPFRLQRVFSADKLSFREFDWRPGSWKGITYDEIILK